MRLVIAFLGTNNIEIDTDGVESFVRLKTGNLITLEADSFFFHVPGCIHLETGKDNGLLWIPESAQLRSIFSDDDTMYFVYCAM